jgi:DNA-binding CsgD family transcriptional regulator
MDRSRTAGESPASLPEDDPERDAQTLAAAGHAFDLQPLSRAERRVLAEAIAGHSAREIAASLVLSEATVRSHLSHVYAKLDVDGRVDLLARIAERTPTVEAGLVQQPPASLSGAGSSHEAWMPGVTLPGPGIEASRLPGSDPAPIVVGAIAATLVSVVFPPIAIATLPVLLVVALVGRRAREGSALRRATPWVFVAASIVALWLGAVLLGIALFFPVSLEPSTDLGS